MTNIVDRTKCVGCAVCKNVCPVNAISMEEDREGFLYPVISEELCVDCKKCKENCPILNENNCPNRLGVPVCYVCQIRNQDDLMKSSSGGAFWAFCKMVIDAGGVVYGAVEETVDRVVHVRATKLAEAKAMRGSKYLQSEVESVYGLVKEDVEAGRFVLFSGTPCQIAGLGAFLGFPKNNLVTCEVICHGVPSKHVWKSFLKEFEKIENTNVVKVIYRDKSFGWSKNHYHLISSTGKSYKEQSVNQLFHAGYLQGLYYRPSCGDCKFACLPRGADISLADFWNYHGLFDSVVDREKGLSLVICNTEQGLSVFDKVKKHLNYELSTIEDAIASCHHLTHHPKHSPDRKAFFKQLQLAGFNSASKRYTITESNKHYFKRIRRKLRAIICRDNE